MTELATRAVDVQRAAATLVAQAQAPADDGTTTIGGYGVAYGADEPNDWGRIFVHGSFADSIAQLQKTLTAKPIPIGWLHSTPIGKWTTIRDDLAGPYLEGPLSQTSLGQDAAVLAHDGLTALSIGFVPLVYQFAEPGEVVSFDTPYGRRTYQQDCYCIYIVQAELCECSMVLVGADDDARITLVQSQLAQADRALPGLAEGAAWGDVAYSMALVMGGRGAASFQELPDFEHRAVYERLAAGYRRQSKTPPAYSRRPQYRDVEFQHDERAIFHDRYLKKTLAAVTTGAQGVEGQLSPETREEAERAIQTLSALVDRRDPEELLAEMAEQLRQTTDSLKGTTDA